MEKSLQPDFQIKTRPDLLLKFVQKLQVGRSKFKKVKVLEFRMLFSNSFQENERIFVVHIIQVTDIFFFKSVNGLIFNPFLRLG